MGSVRRGMIKGEVCGQCEEGYDKGGGLWAVYGGGMIKGEVCGQCMEGE